MATLVSVQSGQKTFSGASTTDPIPTTVTTANSILFATYTVDSVSPTEFNITVEITDGDTITMARNAGAGSVTVSWFVAEFSAGVIARRGNNTQTAATSTATFTAITVAQSFTFMSYQSDGGSFGDDDMFTHQIQSTTTMDMVAQKAPASGNTKHWQVTDFDDCSVQRGIETAVTAASVDITISALTDITKAFAVVSPRLTSADGLVEPDEGSITAEIIDTTTLRVTRTGTQSLEIGWEVIEFTGVDTLQKDNLSFGTGETVKTVNLIREIDTTKCSLFCSFFVTSGASSFATTDNYGTARVFAEILSSTQIRFTRALTGTSTLDLRWYLLEFGGPSGRALHSGAIPQVIF